MSWKLMFIINDKNWTPSNKDFRVCVEFFWKGFLWLIKIEWWTGCKFRSLEKFHRKILREKIHYVKLIYYIFFTWCHFQMGFCISFRSNYFISFCKKVFNGQLTIWATNWFNPRDIKLNAGVNTNWRTLAAACSKRCYSVNGPTRRPIFVFRFAK